MTGWIPDATLERLREAMLWPDLTGTRYRAREVIDRGGMGIVFLADDLELEREVALKVLDGVDLTDEHRARMVREARILASLEHPGLVPVYEVGTLPDGRVYYAMQRIRGERLDQAMLRPQPLPDRIRLLVRICETVAYAHARGIVHRDLKPPNVMVGAFGEVKVVDWGLAKVIGDAAESSSESARIDAPLEASAKTTRVQTEVGAILGTPGYMAPEQTRGESERIGPWTDVYALGALLEFLLAAEGKDVPRPLAAIASRARAEDPSDRYPSAAQLASELSRYLDRLPVAAYRENLLERSARWAGRYKLPLSLIAAYLVMRAALLLFSGK